VKRRLALLFAILGLLLTSVAAAEPPFPRLFDVIGVANDAVLNLRARPSGTAEIIGSRPPHAGGTEAVDQNGDGTWLRLGVGETSGWASARYLSPQGFDGPILRHPTRCFGVEPFWHLDISGDGTATLTGPQTGRVTFERMATKSSVNRTDRFRLGSNGRPLGVLAQTLCSDGMSDRVYGYEINLFAPSDGTALLTGCCTITP